MTDPLLKAEAQWNISLDCNCPHCKEYVDLTGAPDFWEGLKMEAGEHGTENSSNVAVYCPECGEEFTIDAVF